VAEGGPLPDLSAYRRLIDLRRSRTALTQGAYRPLAATGDVLAYERLSEDDRLMVVLNLGPQQAVIALPAGTTSGIVLVSTDSDRDGQKVTGAVSLRGYDGAVIELCV
jgi:alpha-glucosidase